MIPVTEPPRARFARNPISFCQARRDQENTAPVRELPPGVSTTAGGLRPPDLPAAAHRSHAIWPSAEILPWFCHSPPIPCQRRARSTHRPSCTNRPYRARTVRPTGQGPRSRERVLGPGHDEQLEVLVGGDEPVGQSQRVVRVDLVVHSPWMSSCLPANRSAMSTLEARAQASRLPAPL